MIVKGKDVVKWVCEGTSGTAHEGLVGIGYVDSTGNLIGALTFENYSGSNVFGHQRFVKPVPRGFWRVISYYLFDQLKVKRLTGIIDEANKKSIKMAEHMGFEYETTLKQAGPEGRDYLIYVMWEKNCKFRNW